MSRNDSDNAAGDESTPVFTDDPPGRHGSGSSTMDLARGLLGIVGDDETVEEFEDQIDHLLGDADGAAIDGAFLSGVTGAIELGAQVAEVREQVRAAGAAADGPVVHARERELAGGGVAVRVLCSTPDATLYRGDDHLLVLADGGRREVPLGFAPGDVEYADTESMTEAVVYPADYEAPAALPAGEDEDGGEDDTEESEEGEG